MVQHYANEAARVVQVL